MKRIALIITMAFSLSHAFTNQYSINYETIFGYKQEMAERETGCDIQKNQISKYKYFEEYLANEEGVVDNISVDYMSKASGSFVPLDQILDYNDIQKVHNDIRCMIYEGAVFGSAIKHARSSIKARRGDMKAPNLNAAKGSLVFDRGINRIYKRAMKDTKNLKCVFSGEQNQFICNHRKFVFDIAKQSLTYKGMTLYSEGKFYGYGMSRNNNIMREN